MTREFDSFISKVTIETSTATITVEFEKGSVYNYHNATEEIISKIMEAEKIGAVYNKYVRPLPFEKII